MAHMEKPAGWATGGLRERLAEGLDTSDHSPDRRALQASAKSADPRRQHLTRHLHQCGPRPVLEALQEVAGGRPLDAVLADYGRLDPKVCRALGGDRFPPPPLSEVA